MTKSNKETLLDQIKKRNTSLESEKPSQPQAASTRKAHSLERFSISFPELKSNIKLKTSREDVSGTPHTKTKRSKSHEKKLESDNVDTFMDQMIRKSLLIINNSSSNPDSQVPPLNSKSNKESQNFNFADVNITPIYSKESSKASFRALERKQ